MVQQATMAVHAGEDPRIDGAVVTPVFQSAMYQTGSEVAYHDIRYIRLNNTPNHRVVAEKIAALEGGEAALVAGSGMAAISAALFAFLSSGDHLLVQSCLYGGTHGLAQQELTAFGIEHTAIDARSPESWEALVRPRTRVIYVEAMTNPLLEVADLRAIAAFARAHDLVAIIDNTFATPFNFQPLAIGFDLSLHSGTKYLNGHSDIVAGAVAGSASFVDRVRHRLNHLGGTLDPHACFLLQRGLKTLPLRMAQHNQSALAISEHLARHRAVRSIHYPGLPAHPDHPRARELFRGFGGMLSFELNGGVDAAERFISKLRIPLHAPSLGGVETLVTRPATTSHAGIPREDRERIGLSDALVRLSVGIEDTGDLIADLDQALSG
jgi:cystathionine beta-lyase/cystathionine gamma-synthase